MTRVFVVIVPTGPWRPVRGNSTPRSAGWFVTESGVAPWATYQTISPTFRSIAVIRPHGGFISGRPMTVCPGPRAGPLM